MQCHLLLREARVLVRSLPYSPASQTALASALGFSKGIFAKHGCAKTSRCVWWAYSSSSLIVCGRFTAGSQRVTEAIPLSRLSPAQVFSQEKAQAYSHCWVMPGCRWGRSQSHGAEAVTAGAAATLLATAFEYWHFLFLKKQGFFTKGGFAKHPSRSQLTRVIESHETHFVNWFWLTVTDFCNNPQVLFDT